MSSQEHPNAFDPWTENTDSKLTKICSEGASVNDIAEHFGRKPSAIITRIKKLNQ